MTAFQMLAKLVLNEKTTVGEGKRIVKFLGKISKGQKLTLTEFNFLTKLYNKHCE